MKALSVRGLLALAAMALCLAALGSCGEDEPKSTSATSPTEAEQTQADAKLKAHNEDLRKQYEQRQAAKAPTEEEQQAEQTATDFYAILDEDEAKANPNRTTIDSASFCELMSEEAQAQTIHYAKVSSGVARDWDCESAVELLVLRSKRNGGFTGAQRAEVIGVHAEGDRATATVRLGDGPATSLPLVREDGEWKLAARPGNPGPTK